MCDNVGGRVGESVLEFEVGWWSSIDIWESDKVVDVKVVKWVMNVFDQKNNVTVAFDGH